MGFVGAGPALWGYLQELDRLVPRGLALEGPICARRRELWPELLERRPEAELVADALDVVRSGVDVVVVLTPPAAHAPVARLALEHGKHVLVEKPLALSRAEAEELAVLAGARDVHLYASPFVHLSPTLRVLWTLVRRGAIGLVHSGRGLYGNAGSPWAGWYHSPGSGPVPDMAIYNLKTLTAILGPVREVLAAEATAVPLRELGGELVASAPDVSHLVLRHAGGALSSIVSSQAIQRYRRPAVELYGTEGTINLLGDDWHPRGLEVWRNELSHWQLWDAIDETWTWSDGLRELVAAVAEGRAPLGELEQDLHLLDVVDAARAAAAARSAVAVESSFPELALELEPPAELHHVHDHTRPLDDPSSGARARR